MKLIRTCAVDRGKRKLRRIASKELIPKCRCHNSRWGYSMQTLRARSRRFPISVKKDIKNQDEFVEIEKWREALGEHRRLAKLSPSVGGGGVIKRKHKGGRKRFPTSQRPRVQNYSGLLSLYTQKKEYLGLVGSIAA